MPVMTQGLGDSRDGSGAAAPNVAGGDPSTLYQGMLPADMTVRQLRLALRDAGLATSGNKLELIARLERHLTSPPPSLETTSAEEMECAPDGCYYAAQSGSLHRTLSFLESMHTTS